jgi:hypothetical protein
MDIRMNRNYDGCTDEHSLSQNLLMEKKKTNFKTKLLLALSSCIHKNIKLQMSH